MKLKLSVGDVTEMILFAGKSFQSQESRLNRLDAAIGDGDHGITMRKGFLAVQDRLSNGSSTCIGDVFMMSGRAFVSATGGAIGVILGKGFMQAGQSLQGVPEMGPGEFKEFLGALESAVASIGKVQPGDKTILDSIHAARSAVKESESSLLDLMKVAAQAATKAAQDTAKLRCRVGRASRLGERSIGHPDPGAVTFGLLLGAMSEWCESQQ